MYKMINFKSIKNYSRIITVIKASCTMIIFALICLLVILPYSRPAAKYFELSLSSNKVNQNEPSNLSKMSKPRFYGISLSKEFYNIVADKAVEQANATFLLEKINADITFKDKRWLNVNAAQGVWSHDQHTLSLKGSVDLFYDNNYEVRTDNVSIDMNKDTAKSNSKFAAQGSLGTIEANGFTFLRQEKKLRFNGPVKVVIYNKNNK